MIVCVCVYVCPPLSQEFQMARMVALSKYPHCLEWVNITSSYYFLLITGINPVSISFTFIW